MALTISQNKFRHRFDSPNAPVFTGSGWVDIPRWFIRNHFAAPASNAPLAWSAPNRTDAAVISLRDFSFWAWSLAAGISRDTGNNRFSKTGGASFSGALGTTLAAGNCSIEGKPVDFSSTNMLALQSGTNGYSFLNGEIEHALVFGQNGVGQIWELGQLKENANFDWEVGDKGLVELHGAIVRYYKISLDGSMRLLRSTRSKLVYPVAPTLGIFHTGGTFDDILVWFGDEAAAAVQIYGVLKDFQDWQNKGQIESLAEKTMNKDKSEDFTYFTNLKTLRSLSVSVSWEEGASYRNFVEFYKWHSTSREFIFADAARGGEYFARFISAFSDAPLGADTFGMAADLREMVNAPGLAGL